MFHILLCFLYLYLFGKGCQTGHGFLIGRYFNILSKQQMALALFMKINNYELFHNIEYPIEFLLLSPPNIFFMWTIFKVLIEFVTGRLLFSVSAFWPPGKWELNSQTRVKPRMLCLWKVSFNRWTTRQVPSETRFNLW